MIKLYNLIKEENWKADKSVITLNGKEVGDYSFDRDSDAFWIDDLHGKSQKAFDTKEDMINYIKKNKVAYLKARRELEKRGYIEEAINQPVEWPDFYRNTDLRWKSSSPMWDSNGNALVDITLKSKPTADFVYKFSIKKANVDDYVQDRRLRMPTQVKQTIYDKFYKNQSNR